MTPDELVARIQAGGGTEAVRAFLSANPNITPTILAQSAANWGVDDVSETILTHLLEHHPADVYFNHQMGTLLLRRERFEEALPYFRAIVRDPSNAAKGYAGLSQAYCRMNDLGRLRETLAEAQSRLPEDQHADWQVPNPEAGRSERSAVHRKLVEQERQRRQALFKDDPPTGPAPASAPSGAEATAATGRATEIGETGATLTGRVAGGRPGAVYRFEYGTTPEGLDRSTPWQAVPGRLNADVHAAPFLTPGVIRLHAGACSVEETTGGRSAYIGEWPFCKDPNHLSGIGFIDLTLGIWFNSCNIDGLQQCQPWESIDLRDAEVTMTMTSENLDNKDFQYVLGVGDGAHYWFLSSQPVDLSSIGGRREMTVTFTLTADPRHWTTAGNNPDEQADAARYFYGPLDTLLGAHKGNIVLVAASGDWRDTPVGKIGLQEVSIRYRDRSVLHPDNGARLVAGPDAGVDPGALTNGLRGTLDSGWYRAGVEDLPATFTWTLPASRQLRTVIFHQDPVWPTSKFRLKVTLADGKNHSWDLSMPPVSPDSYENTPVVLRLPEGLAVSALSLELVEAASADGIGLMAVEAFAADAAPTPSPTPASVCADVTDLTPGIPLYYRVVCRDGETRSPGDIMTFTPPAAAPLLHAVDLDRSADGTAVFRVRANPMGQRCRLTWRIDDGGWSERSMGWEPTSAHRFITIRNLTPGNHRLTVRLLNEDGSGPETETAWKQP